MEALDEEIKRIEEDEEDDKAMGQDTPEKLAANKEVSFLFFFYFFFFSFSHCRKKECVLTLI